MAAEVQRRNTQPPHTGNLVGEVHDTAVVAQGATRELTGGEAREGDVRRRHRQGGFGCVVDLAGLWLKAPAAKSTAEFANLGPSGGFVAILVALLCAIHPPPLLPPRPPRPLTGDEPQLAKEDDDDDADAAGDEADCAAAAVALCRMRVFAVVRPFEMARPGSLVHIDLQSLRGHLCPLLFEL